MSSFWESLGRGAGQGATFGFGDEGIAAILSALPTDTSADGGIPREYAAGSQYADTLNSERNANRAAAEANPGAYLAGSTAGGLPAAIASGGASSIPAAGLVGGAMGALRGAGTADGGDMADSIGRNAGFGAALGAGGAAALTAAPAVKNAALSFIDDITPTGMAPAMATVGGGTSRIAAPSALPSGAQISRAGMLPPRPTTGDLGELPSIPRAPKPLVREDAVDAAEDFADASMVSNTQNAILGGERASQQAARGRAQQAFEKANASSKPKAVNTEASSKATVPPKRRPAAPRATEPAPTFEVPTGIVRKPQATVPAPAPQGTPSMRPTMPAPAPSTPSLRPTLMDLGPVKPTLRPGSDQEYMDAVLRAIEVPPPLGR